MMTFILVLLIRHCLALAPGPPSFQCYTSHSTFHVTLKKLGTMLGTVDILISWFSCVANLPVFKIIRTRSKTVIHIRIHAHLGHAEDCLSHIQDVYVPRIEELTNLLS